jgi:hypothetical protein
MMKTRITVLLAVAVLSAAAARAALVYQSHVIANDGGSIPGVVEPGETFELILTSTNNGAALVNVTNILQSSTYFQDITPLTSTVYPSVAAGATASTRYRITCASGTPLGIYTLGFTNSNGAVSSAGSFQVTVANGKYLNEWLFDRDAAGLTLSQAINTGTDGAAFGADSGSVTRTDGTRYLTCNNTVSGSGYTNFWNSGAVLRADVTNQTAGVRYLRYDFYYDLASTNNNSGTLLGLSFVDSSGSRLSGVALRYSAGDGAPPSGIKQTVLTNVTALTGKISAIAKVNLTSQTMNIWYNLSGENSFNLESNPNATVAITSMTSIDQLEFRATGDLIDSSSNKCIRIDNIRDAATWGEIIEPVQILRGSPVLDTSISGASALTAGQTYPFSVTIQNSGALASNVYSTLTHNGGTDLMITTNAGNTPTTVRSGGSTVNSYALIVSSNAVGPYTLTAQSFAAGGYSSDSITFAVFVGARVGYYSHTIANDTGGVLPGTVEPGEAFDLILTSINDSAETVLNITNSLLSSAYFTVLSNTTSNVYPSLAPGNTASTTYRVVCSADTPNGDQPLSMINRTANNEWPSQFNVQVVREARLAANNLTMRLVYGETVSGVVTVTNTGNFGTPFTVTHDGRVPVYYTSTNKVEFVEDLELFWPADFEPDTVFTWSGTNTTAMAIGFPFILYGIPYDTFSVTQDGTIALSSSTTVTNRATLLPFGRSNLVDKATIRYRKSADRLVVSWGHTYPNDTGTLESQAWLNSDGTIQCLYEDGVWGAGIVGMKDYRAIVNYNNDVTGYAQKNVQTNSYTPGSRGKEWLLWTSIPWVTWTPTNTVIGGAGASKTVTFVADTTNLPVTPATTNRFTALINWDGNSYPIDVTVYIIEPANVNLLDVPATFTFSGPAGFISPPASMTISNRGTVSLPYIITDDIPRSEGYDLNWVDYQWRHIPDTSETVLKASDLNSKAIPIGFPFAFFGTVYTNVTVSTTGTLTFAFLEKIIPCAADLMLDDNAQVRYLTNIEKTEFTVNWLNMNQPGGDPDQTFEVVLRRDGSFLLNYQRLGLGWTNSMTSVERFDHTDSANTTWLFGYRGTLINDVTSWIENVITTNTVYVTNSIGNYHMVTTTNTYTTNSVRVFADEVIRQSLEFVPVQLHTDIISVSPQAGTVAPTNTAVITLRGDARRLTSAGSNNVGYTACLRFNGGRRSLVSASDSYEWRQTKAKDSNNNLLPEWYFVKTDGTDPYPYLVEPNAVYTNNTTIGGRVTGGIGKLNVNQWAWGRSAADNLTFDTIYARITPTNSVDPDTLSEGYVKVDPATTWVTFTATNSVQTAYPADASEDSVLSADVVDAAWGNKNQAVRVEQSADGRRTLSWPAAEGDTLSREYIIQYTTILGSGEWISIGFVTNATTYIDNDVNRNNEPVIFYRVLVN